jgi:Helix-turn-helix domain
MSIQAVAWALRQVLPPIPKFVLVALCERADEETGECWPGIRTVAKAVCLSERSVVTYIGALVRNGYVDRRAMRGKDGRKRSNHYWIIFDRPEAPWIGAQKDENEDDAHEDEPHANPALGEDAELHAQTDSYGPRATGFPPHIELEPSGLEPSESQQEAPAPSPPVNFNPKARTEQVERRKAAEEARQGPLIPIIEGTEPWEAHVKAGHPRTLIGKVVVNGKERRGWYFKRSECNGLYPKPKQTGPPPLGLCTPEDEAEFLK